MKLQFEWDEAKAASNLAKHGVSFEEASSVFSDTLAAIFEDERHSQQEIREIVIGHSSADRLLVISFTERDEHLVRIISARKATKRERQDYEQRDPRS